MANKVYESPGYYATEKDLTFSTEVIGVTTLGLVGETLKGPAMQPMFIKNYEDFQTMFGGTNSAKFKNTQIPKYELSYIAKSYLSQSNQLYVTRVLGLSGYNADMAYVIRTIGAVNTGFTTTSPSSATTIEFYIDNTVTPSVFKEQVTDEDLIDVIAAAVGVDKTLFSTGFTGYYYDSSAAPFQGNDSGTTNNGVYWGTLTSDVTTNLNTGTTGGTLEDAYLATYPDVDPTYEEQHWMQNTFEFVDNGTLTGDTYTGHAFAFYCDAKTIRSATGGTYNGMTTGTTYLYNIEYTGTPILDYHNKVVATLRSRGLYDGSKKLFTTGSTVGMSDYTAVLTDPFANFSITGTTVYPTGQTGTFTYTVNLDTDSTSYIKNVLGSNNLDKDADLFVEDIYPNMLVDAYNRGYIKGLSPVIDNTGDWGNYNMQYQTPVTPWFVSELRGDLPERLFRFVSISDGNSANTEIKVSIANVNLDTKTFDVQIRAFNDTDRMPIFLEKYIKCSMNPSSVDYVAKKIGTSDNQFELRSSYVMVEMSEQAPTDAVPAGFEGFPYRFTSITDVAKVSYKLKYYNPSEVIYTSPIDGSTSISTGDKITKNYLGFSDTIGIDSDLFQYKGEMGDYSIQSYNVANSWTKSIQGFHMDKNAADILDVYGNPVFQVGVGQFTDNATLILDSDEPYHDIRTRKFTACFYGGFDGWDIFRYSRTNTDNYRIGLAEYILGGFTEFNINGQDDTYGTSDYYAYLIGLQTMQNPEEVNINILATPTIDLLNNTELVKEAIEIVEEKRTDSIYLPTLPDIKLLDNPYPANTNDWYYPSEIVSYLEDTEIDSNYAAVYYPWYQIYDSENETNLFIAPTTDVVRNLALTDNIAHPWYATAGYKRGLVNAKRTRMRMTQSDRDTLYGGRINPLATFTDVGVTIWGNRNLQEANTALNRLNIRRLLLQCKKLIGQVGNRLLFDPNDDTIRNEFISLVNPILDNIRKERGLVDFRVKLLPQTEGDDRNTLRGKIYLKPTYALEVIDLEFTVTPTNVSFDNF